jgi:hypothetical protein
MGLCTLTPLGPMFTSVFERQSLGTLKEKLGEVSPSVATRIVRTLSESKPAATGSGLTG